MFTDAIAETGTGNKLARGADMVPEVPGQARKEQEETAVMLMDLVLETHERIIRVQQLLPQQQQQQPMLREETATLINMVMEMQTAIISRRCRRATVCDLYHT